MPKAVFACGGVHFFTSRRMPVGVSIFFESPPDFEGEFINMFPVNRSSVLEGFRSNLKRLFVDSSDKMFDRLV